LRGFAHFGSEEDPVITNNAEGKPKEIPAASWVFLVTDSFLVRGMAVNRKAPPQKCKQQHASGPLVA